MIDDEIAAQLAEIDRLMTRLAALPAAESGDPARALAALREKIDACHRPARLKHILYDAGSMTDWLGRQATDDEARQDVARLAAIIDKVTREWNPPILIEFVAEDLLPWSNPSGIDLDPHIGAAFREVTGDAEESLDDLHNLLVSPPPAVPTPSPELFDVFWKHMMVVEKGHTKLPGLDVETVVMGYDDKLVEDADRTIPGLIGSSGPVFVTWSYAGVKGLTDTETVITSWEKICNSGFAEDVVIFPPDAGWIISYFHHDTLFLGKRRIQDWPHQVVLPAGLR